MFKFYFVISGVLIALGFTPVPIIPDNLGRGGLFFNLLICALAVAPLVPLFLSLLHVLVQKPLSRTLAFGLAIPTAVISLVLSVLSAALSGVGATIALIHGLSLTLAVSASFLLLSEPIRGNSRYSIAAIVLLVPLIVALWSLGSVVTIKIGADRLSGDRSFCIATHSRASPIRSFAQLRGLSFYSTASGYKDSSRWYFHGLLVVKAEPKNEIYNWSPRNMAFHRIERPERFIVTPIHACEPNAGFWKTLAMR